MKSSIYTRTGDGGKTSLVDSPRVPKDSLHVCSSSDILWDPNFPSPKLESSAIDHLGRRGSWSRR